MTRPAFVLTKWYLDLVADDGTALVGYWARLHWGPIRLGYVAMLRSAPGVEPEESVSIRQSEDPHEDGDLITWRSTPLGVAGEWRRESPPIDVTLLEIPDGDIQWTCTMPRARATIEWRGATHTGRGYAEMLRLTIPPNRLPFRTLRWGHHASDGHAVVWIEWDGESTRRWTWLDGSLAPTARVTTTGVDLGDGAAVRFSASRDLRNRRVAAGLPRVAPAVRRRLLGSLGAMREHKIVSRSALTSADGTAVDAGWAIHEEVTW